MISNYFDILSYSHVLFLADVKASKVRTVIVPQYEGLTIKEMDEEIFQSNSVIYSYLPDQVEIHKTPKQWIVNVAASVLEDTFTDWVKH